MSEQLIRQEYYCSFDVGASGSYWSLVLTDLRHRKPPQIGFVPYNPNYAVYTAWDVGYTTCLWVFQVVGQARYYLRYYEAQGEGIKHFCELLETWRKEHGYYYGKHFGPWDIDSPANKTTTGQTVREIGAEHGVHFTNMPMDKDVNNSIERAKQALPLCWFDQRGCDIGLDALEWYHVKSNERMSTEGRPYFIDVPEKDWSEHCARAFIISDQGIPFIEHGTSSVSARDIQRFQKKYGLTG